MTVVSSSINLASNLIAEDLSGYRPRVREWLLSGRKIRKVKRRIACVYGWHRVKPRSLNDNISEPMIVERPCRTTGFQLRRTPLSLEARIHRREKEDDD